MTSPDSNLLRTIVQALDDAGVDYMVTGSMASALHGEPRSTRDIDLVINPDETTVELLVSAFPAERFYVGDGLAAVRRRDMFNVIDLLSGWKADLIIIKNRPFSRTEFERRRPAVIGGVETYVTTPEDAILSKLEWQSVSPSDTQRRDVVEMIVANGPRLDGGYLDRWAAELGVTDLLRIAWAAADSQR